jgi:hypothetical protein
MTRILGFAVLLLLYARVRAKFLIFFLVGNIFQMGAQVLDAIYPSSPNRPFPVGVLIEGMLMLRNTLAILGAGLCVRWFTMTRRPQQSVGGDGRPAPQL